MVIEIGAWGAHGYRPLQKFIIMWSPPEGGAKESDLDKVLETKDFKVENKKFFFDLKENPKGKYLRITESSGGRSSIVIPENGLKAFCEILQHFVEVERKVT